MQQQNNRKRVLWISACAAATLVLVLIGFVTVQGWQEVQRPPAPIPPKSQPQKIEPVSSVPAQATPAPVSTEITGLVPQSGNLGRMTSLRAQLEEAKLLAQIAQEQEKLIPKQPSQPPPQPQVVLSEPAKPTEVKQVRQNTSPVVLSIQGMDGHASATIRNSSGTLVTVRPGERFGSGIVASVSRSGVQVKHGNNISTLSFE